jgi:cellulose synthase/poly-beta-1,6-N-acetylglucosamine synthase-like glycosyltransferase/peptidoglycan/xylan/chitin deacetylase (PgdA/CDA1 family)/spore germination protein YaaH
MLFITIVTILLASFLFSLFATPFLPFLSIRAKAILANNSSQNNGDVSNTATESANPNIENSSTPRPTSIGFYVNWDDTSYASLKRNIDKLDWFAPEWIRLKDGDDPLVRDFDQKALDLIHQEKPNMPILPLVQNYVNEQFNSEILAREVATPESRQKLINALVKTVEDNKFAGLTVDLEEVPRSSQNNLYQFMKELHATFQTHNWIIAQAVPFDNPDWDYKAYAQMTDYMMLMAYDEHWATGQPGAIASQDWFEKILAKRMKELDPKKTIICIGNYGYDWSDKSKEAEDISFQEAVLSARDSEATIKFDPATKNPYFSFDEDDGSHHTVWFLDGVTAYNEIKASEKYQPFGIALWRLGSEDPSLWDVFGQNTYKPQFENLKSIRYGYDIDFEGTGEILQVVAEPQAGSRVFNFDADSAINNENYTAIPSSYVIQRAGDHPGLVALTFDDGPDPQWTPQILDVLKKENVPATFFIVGEYGQENPELLRRIVSEGHDIGNHSFTHPNMGEIPTKVTEVELNATQRLIQSATGRSTMLFRAPYFGDAEPTTADEVDPIVTAKNLGYIAVGLHIDPDDWEKPGAETIVQRTVDGITNQSTDADIHGQIVLLHDGGGNRSQTVEALPEIIDALRAKGYQFVTVSKLAGLSQDKTMPLVAQNENVITNADNLTFSMIWLANKTMKWLFMLGIILGTGRILFVTFLALNTRLKKHETNNLSEEFQPFVSVIVPAFNEERVITKTIKSLLKSTYSQLEILVVDDGSTDNTSFIVEKIFADEPRVHLFTIANGGKDNALNFGLKESKGEIIIGLDADTLFTPSTIGELAKHFADKSVGAVAGNAKVGNRLNMITKWQALEYITSQNLDRRAFASLNAITVVPGAVGGWRREALEKAGGFESNTLAEDQDLTLRVRMLGYKIAYAENAVAYTEAPDSFRGLAKQRFRWSFGTLQCMWKYRRALFNKKYGALGWAAMPNVWIFQILFPLVSPLMDLMFIWTLIGYLLQRLEHPHEFLASHFSEVAFYYVFFLLVDVLAASVGFAFERKENWKLLAWLPIQRFGYRQVIYWVMLKSVKTAFKGVIVGWNKVERKDTVPEAV